MSGLALVTGAVNALATNKWLGRAEALRQALLAMTVATRPLAPAAHPSVWPPFVVVGEGGAER